MAVSKKARGLYMGFFDGVETFAANTISVSDFKPGDRIYSQNEITQYSRVVPCFHSVCLCPGNP